MTAHDPVDMQTTETLDPASRVTQVALTVTNLEKSLSFYTTVVGLTIIERNGSSAVLGAGGSPLLLLYENISTGRWPVLGYTGLYHFAILVPTRAELGRWLEHWLTLGNPLPGQGDHWVSEALYISDPDRHGIEIYRDRPTSEWPHVNGRLQMGADPVDIQGLLDEAQREAQPWNGLAAETRLGHMHLQVGNLDDARSFYSGVLGFTVTLDTYRGALFLAAGEYHHHIGVNIWQSRGAGPAPANVASLRWFTVALPSQSARDDVVRRIHAAGLDTTEIGNAIAVNDPWNNRIMLLASMDTSSGDVARLLESTTQN